jgi:hypothetical protein
MPRRFSHRPPGTIRYIDKLISAFKLAKPMIAAFNPPIVDPDHGGATHLRGT